MLPVALEPLFNRGSKIAGARSVEERLQVGDISRIPGQTESPAASCSRIPAAALGFLPDCIHAVWKPMSGRSKLLMFGDQRFSECRVELPKNMENSK